MYILHQDEDFAYDDNLFATFNVESYNDGDEYLIIGSRKEGTTACLASYKNEDDAKKVLKRLIEAVAGGFTTFYMPKDGEVR